MECEKFNKEEKECVLCKQAHDLWEIMTKLKEKFGDIAWVIIDAYIDVLAKRYSEKEMMLITEKVDTLQQLESFSLN